MSIVNGTPYTVSPDGTVSFNRKPQASYQPPAKVVKATKPAKNK